jgi:hypothetical protein
MGMMLCLIASAILVRQASDLTYARHEPLAIRSVTLSASSVPEYGMVEIKVDLAATYENPFDPSDIRLDAHLSSPKGERIEIPGFLFQTFTRKLVAENEVLAPASKPDWRFRFSPQELGAYTLTVSATDRSGTKSSTPIKLVSTAPTTPGFVSVSSRDNRFFAFDDGSAYWPLGPNICWGGNRGTFSYDDWLPKYKDQGVNYSRLWLSPSWATFALEQPGKPAEGKGMGRFDLGNAWRLDYVLDEATRDGIYLMLCIDSYNILRPKDASPWWEKTPHNRDNGGPLRMPADFWTSHNMEKLYQDKLRYLVARYGAYSHTLSWEFWNEVDLTADFDLDTVREWHQRMGEYLHKLDPYNHMVTTSEANTAGWKPIDLLPQLDYFQTHHYGPDPANEVLNQQSRKGGQGKPHYVGEIGADAGGSRTEDDPTGIQVHDPIWASIACGSSGNAASWWWDTLIPKNDLYSIYGAAHRFIQDVDWPSEDFHQQIPSFAYRVKPSKPERSDLDFANGPTSWQPSDENQPKRIVIRNGAAKGPLPVSGIQHGVTNHRDLHNPVVFDVSLDRPTRFDVTVGDVSGYGGATLQISLDGNPIMTREFADPDGASSGQTLTNYAKKYGVEIPKGNHVITVENIGIDWFMAGYTFKDIVVRTKPAVEGWSVIGNTKVLSWIRLAGRSWRKAVFEKMAPSAPAVVGFAGLASGKWRAEIWDTWAGKPISSSTVSVTLSGKARVDLPSIGKEGSLAIKLTKI